MKKIVLFLLATLLFTTQQTFAVPAVPWPVDYELPDGSKITIQLRGDEWVNWAETSDGFTLLRNSEGFFEYAVLNNYGDLTLSGVKAHNESQRSVNERNFLVGKTRELRFSESQIETRLQLRGMMDDFVRKSADGTPQRTTGTVRIPIILVGFADRPFTKTKAEIEMLCNQPNLTSIGGNTITGSLYDYFYAVSYGQLQLQVDVFGPYRLPGNLRAYTLPEDCSGGDTRNMARLAIDSAYANGCNFANYDPNNTGSVSTVHIIFAGYCSAAGGGASCNTIWSHAWSFSPARYYNGKSIGRYSCSPELGGSISSSGSTLATIGTLAHELGHSLLGLPDFYDTDYSGSGGQAIHVGTWCLMASGASNGGSGATAGRTPAFISAEGRVMAGWVNHTVLSTPQDVTIPSPLTQDAVYRVNTTTNNEYFVIENRQTANKWDANVPASGMLIYHVRKNGTLWNSNCINCSPSNRGYYIKQAGCATTNGCSIGANDVWPRSTFTSFTDNSTPNARSWAGVNTEKPITEITHNTAARTISFKFMGGNVTTVDVALTEIVTPTSVAHGAGLQNVTVNLKNLGIPITSASITWSVNGNAQTPFSWSGNLASGGSAIVTLGTFNFPVGTHTITATVNAPGDVNPANNTITKTITVTNPFFFEGWESSNTWTVVNGTGSTNPNRWFVGTATASFGTRSMYISNDNGVSNTYTITTSSTTHFYRDIPFPASTDSFDLFFDTKVMGELSSTGTTYYDYLDVWIVPTNFTPVAGTAIADGTGRTRLGRYTDISSWQTIRRSLLPSYAGTTQRLVFSWINDASVGTQPPAAIDNIAIVSRSAPVAATVPYFEGFENTIDSVLPAGWTHSSGTIAWKASGSTIDGLTNAANPRTGSRQMARSWRQSSSGSAWAFSQGIQLNAGATYTVSFWYRAPGWQNPDNLSQIEYDNFKVQIGTSMTITGSGVNARMTGDTILALTNQRIGDWTQVTEQFTPSASGVYYLGFHDMTTSGEGTLIAIDDISIEGATPTYGITLSQTTAHTFTSANFGYAAPTPLSVTINNTGNQPTGALTIALSGTNANDFTLSKTTSNIAAGATDNFTVAPKTGSSVGTYTATVTVAGSNVASQIFNVSFAVSKADGATVGTPTLASATHNSITVNTVTTPSNGQTVEYAIHTTNTTNPTTWQTETTFTGLTPETNYHVYARSADHANHHPGVHSVSAAFTTLAEPVDPIYNITLSESGTYNFTDVTFGYGIQTPLTVTITNTGNQPTGDLYITQGVIPEQGMFLTLSKIDIVSIAVGGTDNFTIVPETGLAVGSYYALIGVNGGSSVSDYFDASFGVNFTVNKADGATVGTPMLASATHNSITINAVTPPNNGQTIEYAIHTTNSANPTIWQTETTFSGLTPETNYHVYARSAEHANHHPGAHSVSVAITTETAPVEPIYSIELSETETYTFPNADFGYGAQTPLTVTVTNTGNQPTGRLHIAFGVCVSPEDEKFSLSKSFFANIAVGDSDSFTVVPKTGLDAETYLYSVVVSNDSTGIHRIDEYFIVSFTVNKAVGAPVAAPTSANVTHNSITVNASTPPSNGQTVEYAISQNLTPGGVTWQDETTFYDLLSNTGYYVFVRSKENTNYTAGDISRSSVMTTLSDPVGISNVENEMPLNVYPNPVYDGRLFLEIPKNMMNETIKIHNLLGKLELTRTADNPKMEIDISNLPNGAYVVIVGNSLVRIMKR
jgi:M6 family metalloprotease-like protein